MKRYLLISLLLCLSASLGADVLYLNEGEEHVGTVKSIADGKIVFAEASGDLKTFLASETAHVLVSKVREGDEHSFVASLTDPFLVSLLASAPVAADYPDADFVTLYRLREFTFQPDGSVSYVRRRIIKIMKEPGLDEANNSLYAFKNREKLELTYAHTYDPSGRIFHLTDDALSEETLNPNTPEYDSMNKVKFAMKKVDLGSVIDLKYTIKTQKPDALHPYMIDSVMGEREPVLRSELVVKAPANFPLTMETFQWPTEPTENLVKTLEEKDGVKTIKVVYRDLKGFIPEQSMLPRSRIFPRLVITPTQTWDDIALAVTKGIEETAPTPALLNAFLADIAVASAPNAVMKAQVLYDAILRRVRLLGISLFDLGRMVPPSTDVALTKKYGNNYARLVLMHFALKQLGISSAIGFVDSWDEGIHESIPTLGQALDVILRINADGKPLYISADMDYLPFGVLPSSYQGARACFIIGGHCLFETLPEGGPDWNSDSQQVFVDIQSDGSFDVSEIRAPRGTLETSLRGLRAAKQREIKNWAQGSVKRVHPKAELISFALSNLDDLTVPVSYTLRYRIPQAALQIGDSLLGFRNYWVGYQAGSASLAKRKYPMEYWACSDDQNTVIFRLPDGFSWVPWGRTFQYQCDCLAYSCNFNQHLRTLIFSDRFRVFRKEYDVNETYPHYREALTRMAEMSNQWILLERTPASAATPVPSGEPGK